MVLARFNRAGRHRRTVRTEKRRSIMGTCDNEFVQPEEPGAPRVTCPGGHYKFDSCVDEALYLWSLDEVSNSAGDSDFEGHLAVVIVNVEEPAVLDEGGSDERTVLVEPGNYLVWTNTVGAVTVTTTESAADAWLVLEAFSARHALWEAGCNPNDPAGHADCEDSCQRPEWAYAAS
jgi:hypothetical protein